MDTTTFDFIQAMAEHMDGWSLQTPGADFDASQRAILVADTDPDARIVVRTRSVREALIFTPAWSTEAAHLSIYPYDPPNPVSASQSRGPEAVARDVVRRLAGAVLETAATLAERVAAEKASIAATDEVVDAVAALLPGSGTLHGQDGLVSVFARMDELRAVSADFRITRGSVEIGGLRPEEQVVIAGALAAIVAARTQAAAAEVA